MISISNFSPDTPIKFVNDMRNLVLLCPNAHWEFDHGILKAEDLGRGQEFAEYTEEMRSLGYIE